MMKKREKNLKFPWDAGRKDDIDFIFVQKVDVGAIEIFHKDLNFPPEFFYY